MAGHKNFKTLLDKMPPDRRARSDARVKEIRREMVLAELRKHSGLSQEDLAEKLGISQPRLSKIENQEDMRIGTLHHLVDLLGGELELIVHMPDGDINLTQFSGDH